MELKDVQFMSAAEKRKVLKQWELFLKYGLQDKHFSKSLYHHLMQHCSFIAHYDKNGFYATYFLHGDDTRRFLSQFDIRNAQLDPEGDIAVMPRSVEYGSTQWYTHDYDDINRAMIKVAARYVPALMGAAGEKALSNLDETFDAKATESDQLGEAARVIHNAIDDLEAVSAGLEGLKTWKGKTPEQS